MISVDGTTTYVYDAFGRRVAKQSGGVSQNEYLYDLGGEATTVFNSSGTWAYGEIYAGGRHVATYSGATTNFLHTDWLGNIRATSSVSGGNSETCSDLPFGDNRSCSGTDWSWFHFTGDEHDPESNLEHTEFRQLSSTQGRWLSPDPYSGSMDLSNPQSLNRYAYVMNGPVNAVDPTGLFLHTLGDPNWFGNCTVSGGPSFCGGPVGTGDNGIEPCPGNDCSIFNQPYFRNSPSGKQIPYWVVPGVNGPVWTHNSNELSAQSIAELGLPTLSGLGFDPFGDGGAGGGKGVTPGQAVCETRVLSAVNTVFGTSFNESNVVDSFFFSGAWNFNITAQNLAAAQFNAISQQGRYALQGSHFGIGPTLHLPSSFHWDPFHVFASSNIGGNTSVLFTAHIDSANGDLFPTGTLFHYFRDVLGRRSRNPCPQA